MLAWTDVNGMKVHENYWYSVFKPEYSGNGDLLVWADWYTTHSVWGRIKVNEGDNLNIKISNDTRVRIDDDYRSAIRYIMDNYDMTGPTNKVLYWELYILQKKTDTGYTAAMLCPEYSYGKLEGWRTDAHVDFFY